MSNTIKSRYWAFVLYPESAPADWIDQLILTGLRFAVSPLHDKDLDPTGNPKKAHYHVMLCWDGPTTFNSAKRFTDSLFQPIPIPLVSPNGYYRYFIHKDNPDKYQYDEKDIKSYNGFDISVYFSSSDIQDAINLLSDLIIDSKITEYSVFCDIVRLQYPQLRNIAFSHTIHFNTLIRSVRHKSQSDKLEDLAKRFAELGGTTTPPQ